MAWQRLDGLFRAECLQTSNVVPALSRDPYAAAFVVSMLFDDFRATAKDCGYRSRLKAGTTCVFVVGFNFQTAKPSLRAKRLVHRSSKSEGGSNPSGRKEGTMTCRYECTFPRRDAPGLCLSCPPLGGRGECRVPAAPALSCAPGSGRTHTSNNEYTGIARHSRTQWFYGLFRALPGDRAFLSPSPRGNFRKP